MDAIVVRDEVTPLAVPEFDEWVAARGTGAAAAGACADR